MRCANEGGGVVTWVAKNSLKKIPTNYFIKNMADIEAAGIIHNGIHLFNCVRINCSSGDMMVLGSPQVFDEGVLLLFCF